MFTKPSQWLLAGVLSVATSISFAKVTPEQASQLGTTLTFNGADPKANADSSIPAKGNSLDGLPAGLQYKKSGDPYPNPYPNEKPLFSITADNVAQYADRLSEGQKALFEKYPKQFRMDIYPSHRDAVYDKKYQERTIWNATNTDTIAIDGLKDYTGGVAFPIPENGAQVMWNARVTHPQAFSDAEFDELAVYGNGNRDQRRSEILTESPYAYEDMPVGSVNQDKGPFAALVFARVLEPARERGSMVIVHEPLDWVNHKRQSWIYLPGSRRVRRAPNVGYDTPNGPGGFLTVDDALGFNGAMDRYDWTLVGKKEIYIPYHNYQFDNPALKYDDLLTPLTPNPDHIRYELHRVWIVEADLKSDKRHVYAKRRFYIDEDNWLIALTDSYDGKGNLWRVGMITTLYDYHLKGYISRAHINHDLEAKAYVASRLVNESRPTNFAAEPKGKGFYTAANLRKLGR